MLCVETISNASVEDGRVVSKLPPHCQASVGILDAELESHHMRPKTIFLAHAITSITPVAILCPFRVDLIHTFGT